jgi:two-component system, cell cycle sensor histidine kinase and response regulator CckA
VQNPLVAWNEVFVLLGAALTIGDGVWPMPDVGTLALTFHLPVPYEVGTILVSLTAAVLASGIALWVVSRRQIQAGATSRRETKEALRRTSQTLQTLIDASPLAILSLDVQGHVRSWSHAAERMFGWSADEVIGELLPIVQQEELPAFRTSIARVLAGESLPGLQARRRRRDGMMLDLRISAAPTRSPDGTVDGIIGVIEDITERKSLGEQLRQAQKMEAVGQLTGGIAHDFNNILTIIITNAGLMAEQVAPEQADLRLELAELQRAALRGADLVRKLLAFSRQRALELCSVSLAEVVREAEATLRRLLPASVEVSVQVDRGSRATINGDAGAIEQMLYNLATNSRDAMPNGGAFRVRVHRAWLDEEHRRARGWGSSGEYVVLAVSDSGCGMTPEVRARVFDPFFTTKEIGKGTGLGMAMIYGLVKQHNGYIDLESEPGRGTIVRLFFPAVLSPEEQCQVQPAARRTERDHDVPDALGEEVAGGV